MPRAKKLLLGDTYSLDQFFARAVPEAGRVTNFVLSDLLAVSFSVFILIHPYLIIVFHDELKQ